MKRIVRRFLSVLIICIVCTSAFGIIVDAIPPTGVAITTAQTEIIIGDSLQLNALAYPSTTSGISWTSSAPDIGKVNNQGLVTTFAPGVFTVTATIEVNGIPYSDSVELTVTASSYSNGIGTANYYILNYDSGRILSLNSFASSQSNACTDQIVNPISEIWEWRITLSSSRKKVRNVFDDTKYLGASLTSGTVYADNNSNNRLDIYRMERGAYQGYYLIKSENKFVTENANHQVVLTTTPTAKSYWSFFRVEKSGADFFNFDSTYTSPTINTTAKSAFFSTSFNSYNYNTNVYLNRSKSVALEQWMYCDDIFIFCGHGIKGGLEFYSSEGQSMIYATELSRDNNIGSISYPNSIISGLPNNIFRNVRCALLIGCNTAADYTCNGERDNLIEEVFSKGAHFVVGMENEIPVGAANAFLEGFFSSMTSGNFEDLAHNYDRGIDFANIYYDNNIVFIGGHQQEELPARYIGDKKQYIAFYSNADETS